MLLLTLAFAGAAWSIWVLTQARETALDDLARRIQATESFSLSSLAPVLRTIERTEAERTCFNRGFYNTGMVRLYVVGTAYSSGPPTLEQIRLLASARDDFKAAARCSPTDGFIWYALWALDALTNDLTAISWRYLALSYEYAPYEGQVSIYRVRDVVPYLKQMDQGLRERVLAEYLRFARDMQWAAARVFAEVDDETKSILLPVLAQLPAKTRHEMANKLDQLDVLVDIPGVDYREKQPWRR